MTFINRRPGDAGDYRVAKDNVDPDTWILFQVRKRSKADYERLVEHVRSLPNPIAELDDQIRQLKATMAKLELERTKLADECLHIAWTCEGGHDYFVETCVQCKKTEVI